MSKTKVVSAMETKDVVRLPQGEFRGTWGGYVARFEVNGIRYQLRTQDGIRTTAAACIIRIDENGDATVETLAGMKNAGR